MHFSCESFPLSSSRSDTLVADSGSNPNLLPAPSFKLGSQVASLRGSHLSLISAGPRSLPRHH